MQKIQLNSHLALGMLILITLSFTLALNGQNMYKSNELLISFKEQTQNGGFSLSAESIGCSKIKTLSGLGTEIWCVPDTLNFDGNTIIGIENIAEYFESSFVGIVKYAEPNYELKLCGEPNDPFYSDLWGMEKIGMPEAWDTQEGSSDIVVGVLDSGIDWTHDDLNENIWQNLGEDANKNGYVIFNTGTEWIFDPGDIDGIDDDGNGYADDFIGWDFYNDNNNIMDNCGHGTHVAGTVGAVGNNNIGVVGVSPNVKLMGLKIFELDSSGECVTSSAFVSDVVEALGYATKMGVKISTNSYRGFGYSQTFKDAIDLAAEQDHLFVAAAGNDNINTDATPTYPASYNSPNVISVAATDPQDNLAVFENFFEASNYGATSVDLAAPGLSIKSTIPGNDYDNYSGTSMSVPHVVGAAVLLKAQCDQLDYQDIKNAILESVDVIIPALEGKCMSGGRLNVSNALKSIPSECQVTESPVNNCLQADATVLIALYNATNGANWTPINWDLSLPMSEWEGVDVNPVTGCVERLELSENNLVGYIPAELGNLSSLTHLDLSFNNLEGNIPTGLGNLSNLTSLNLPDNQLEGEIPTSLGDLSNLTRLSLSNNLLIGEIPTKLVNLTNLTGLFLDGNGLTGEIPFEIGNLTNLENLFLRENSLSGSIPPILGNLSNLGDLRLQSNELTGNIPAELGNLSNINIMGLHDNQLEGCYPQSLCNLPIEPTFVNNQGLPDNGSQLGFKDFCLGVAPPCDPPCAVSDSLALIALYNATNGADWDSIWNLSQPMNTWYEVQVNNDGCVTNINLYGNNLIGTIPPELGNLSNLEALNLSDNGLTGEIPAELGNLSSLQFLALNANDLTGNIPVELGYLSNLNILFLYNNGLEGNIPTSFGNLSNINDVRLYSNELEGNIPTEIGNWVNCTVLDLSGNLLDGNIPSEIGSMSSLNILYLNDNMLTGNIPVELSNLANLEALILSNNQLDGSIPQSLGNLSILTILNLSNNQLSGYIPNELSNLIRLGSLFLNSNELIGVIPATLGNLTNLVDLRLGTNQLIGEIPESLGNLTNINYLVLENNLLTGCYPLSLCGLVPAQMIFINNPGLPDGGLPQGFDDFCDNPDVPCGIPCTESDSLILVDLYNSTNGAEWDTIWNLDMPVSTWANIAWDNDGCHVVGLNLAENNLEGMIPSSIGNLSELTVLDLTGNNLTGFIPIEIGNLSNLEHLHLGSNDLEGNIPSQIGNLTSLYNLVLEGNNLSGNIPTEIGNLTDLNYLSLGNNQLNGSIPAEIGNLTNLVDLNLSDNNLTGIIPTELGNLENLQFLLLNGNNLTGSIPGQLGNMSSLVRMRLDDNNLSGSIPAELGNLSNLTSLLLWGNNLSGCYPKSLCNLNLIEYNFTFNPSLPEEGSPDWYNDFCADLVECPNPSDDTCAETDYSALVAFYNATDGLNWTYTWDLSTPYETWYGVNTNENGCVVGINLGNNDLTGFIPDELSTIINLTELHLNNNNLSGNIPVSLSNCTNLEVMHLNHNQLTGNIPTEFGNLVKMRELNLSFNSLTGQIPFELGNLIYLNELILNNNPFESNIPSSLGQLSNLRILKLNNCQLTGEIPGVIGNATSLEIIDFANNQLFGVINSSFGQLANLRELHLENNLLSGSLPVELGNLSNLEVLHLDNNELMGEIPDSFGNLYNLIDLGLHTNYLNEAIPASLGNLTNLEKLILSVNGFSGNIPGELGNLSNLISLHLNDNQLTGNIPAELGNLSNLTYLNLSENLLEGCYPLSLCDLPLEYFNFKYNVHLHDGGSDSGFSNICTGDTCEFISPCEPFTIDLGPDQDLGCGGSVILSIDFPDTGYIIWDYEGQVDSSLVNETSIEVFLPGTYIVTVADTCVNVVIDSIEVFESNSCVWPGDMDYNQLANYLDVLYWGFDYKKTGPPRINASTDWVRQAAIDWEYTGPGNVNDKHSDANGDGIVDEADLDVLVLNYGKTHNSVVNATPSNASLAIQLDEENSSFEGGQIAIDVNLDENSNSIHGMAWQIDMSIFASIEIPINGEEYNEYKMADASFKYIDDWFGEESTEVVSFYYYDPETYTLDVSVTRIDQQSINAVGRVGQVIVDIDHVGTWAKMDDNHLLQNEIDLRILENAQYIDNQSELFALNTGTSTSLASSGSNSGSSIGTDVIKLNAGWNLISLDVIPFSKKIEDVFANLKPDNLEYVVGYDNGAFAYTHNGDEVFNTLNEIEKGFGYWVKVKEDDALYIYGLIPEETYPKPTNAGWNLTSFHAPYSYSPEIYYNDVIAKDNLAFVTGYDGQELIFDPNNDANTTLDKLDNGMGYWVKLKNAEENGNTENIYLSNVFDFVNGTCNLEKDEVIIIQNQDGSTLDIMAKVMDGGKIMTTPIYGDDPLSTDQIEGLLEGDQLNFIWKGQMLNENINFNGDRTIHNVNLEFEIPTIVDPELANLAAIAYPNPVVDIITFDINLLRPNEKITIEVFNDNGKLMRVFTKTDLKVGINTFTYDFKELPVGRYIYQINGNWSKRIDSFIKLK